MPASHKITLLGDKNTLLIEYLGEVDFDALVKISESVYAHPGYSPEVNGIFDFRQCKLNLDFNDMFAFVKFLAANEQRVRGLCAFVTQSASNYGTTRIFAELGAELQGEINYFENVEDALHWIEGAAQSEFT